MVRKIILIKLKKFFLGKMKKTIFVIISSRYYYKYITNKCFLQLERKYKVYYLFKDTNFFKKNLKVKNKIFYKLDEKSSVWTNYFLKYLRFSNDKKCKTFKAMGDWAFPTYSGLKQIFKQEKKKESFFISYLSVVFKKLIMRILSTKYLSDIFTDFFYKKILIEKNFNNIFSKYKPDLVIYPTHSKEPEVIKIKKLSDFHKFKTFYIIDNWDNLSTGTYYKYKPDFIGVWGKQTKMHAVKIHNFTKKNVFLIGNCRFDNYFRLKKENFVKNNKNYILFVAAKIRVDEIYYLKLLNRVLTENKKIFKNTKIVYRLHPQDKNLEILKNLRNLENVLIDKTVFSDNQIPYFKNDLNILKKNYIPLLINAKFIVGCISSVIIEGLIFNKSYLAIAFKKKNDEFYNPQWWFKNFIHLSGIENVNNVKLSFNEKQYEKMFVQMFKNSKLKKNYSKTKRQLDYFYHKDKLPYDKKILECVEKIF